MKLNKYNFVWWNKKAEKIKLVSLYKAMQFTLWNCLRLSVFWENLVSGYWKQFTKKIDFQMFLVSRAFGDVGKIIFVECI